MRLRFWIGLVAVLLIAAGSVTAALVVSSDDSADFHAAQRDEAVRAAHQAESVASLSIGQLASAAAFFQAEGTFTKHEFDVVARPLLGTGVLSGTAFIQSVRNSERAEFEREHRAPIFEPSADGPRRAKTRAVYYPIVYAVSNLGSAAPLGYDLGGDPERAPFLRRARDLGKPVATPPVKLLVGGIGINVYRPVYRDGAPTATVAQRRAALIGFAAGAFRVSDLATAAISTVPKAVAVQLRINRDTVIGQEQGALDDAASAPIHIADRTWLLVVRDPNRPDVSLPLLLAVVGIALAALLGALILVWSRNERMQELEREAGQDPLTGLKNRRRFEEDLQMAMARARRENTTGALLMLDLDHFKRVNDTHGHPAGDQLIREIADVLRRRGRKSDVLARLGGDEFAVVLPRCSPGEARLAAEAIAAAIRHHEPKGDVEPLTASVGVAIFGDHPRTSIGSVVSEADTAMYAAKDGGRDGVRFFDRVAVRDEGDWDDLGF